MRTTLPGCFGKLDFARPIGRSVGRVVIYVTSRDTMQKWRFAGPDTHRTFDAHDLAGLLRKAGFCPSAIKMSGAKISLGVNGLIAVAKKSGRTIGSDKISQPPSCCSSIQWAASSEP